MTFIFVTLMLAGFFSLFLFVLCGGLFIVDIVTDKEFTIEVLGLSAICLILGFFLFRLAEAVPL